MPEMPTASRLSIRSKKILTIAFSLYATLCLISMATMAIGAFLLALAIFCTSGFASLTEGRNHSLVQEFKVQWKDQGFRFYLICSGLLTAAGAASLVGAMIAPLGYSGQKIEVHFFKDMAKAWYFFWPCLLVLGLKRLSPKQHQAIVNTWLSAFGILSLIGIFQYFVGWPRPQPIPGEPGHFHATLFLGHHLSVASIFIFPFFVTLDQVYLNYRNPRGKVYGLIAVLGFFTLFLTYSRILWLALPLGIFLWTLLTLPKKFKIISSILLLLLGAAAIQSPLVQRRLHDGIGISTRQELWSANMEFLRRRPWTGVGWHHNQELSGYYLMEKHKTKDVFSGHAHNNFLDVLGSEGIFGAFAWLAWCVCVLALLIRNRKSTELKIGFSRGLLCAWFVFQINGLTQVNFWEAKVENQLAWVIAWSLL